MCKLINRNCSIYIENDSAIFIKRIYLVLLVCICVCVRACICVCLWTHTCMNAHQSTLGRSENNLWECQFSSSAMGTRDLSQVIRFVLQGSTSFTREPFYQVSLLFTKSQWLQESLFFLSLSSFFFPFSSSFPQVMHGFLSAEDSCYAVLILPENCYIDCAVFELMAIFFHGLPQYRDYGHGPLCSAQLNFWEYMLRIILFSIASDRTSVKSFWVFIRRSFTFYQYHLYWYINSLRCDEAPWSWWSPTLVSS